jgi:hypothetical protein
MAERHLIALRSGVAVASERLFPGQPGDDPKLLSVIALALCSLIPIYKRDAQSGDVLELSEAELDAHPSIGLLLVSLPHLEQALKRLDIGTLEAARVSLTLRQSPRRSTRQ